jgi:hypothetical protein
MAEQDVVVGVGVERRVQVHQIDGRILDVPSEHVEVVAVEQGVGWHGPVVSRYPRTALKAVCQDVAGWTVLRVWEHEKPEEAADRVEAAVRGQAG